MECPKCHKKISDNTTVCPFCHKVLALSCPNCHSISQSAVCEKCGYIILERCTKCGKMTPTNKKHCKCGFETEKSIAFNECEIDEFASVIISFAALKDLRRHLKSQELYAKFLTKLKNLIISQIKETGAQTIIYGNSYTVNFCKELSFQTSVNKAVRFSLKLVTSFAGLNENLINQFGIPLKMTITIIKKQAEELLINKSIENNIKLMIIKNDPKKYLKGMQVIIDQYCQDTIKEYKTDSLYSLELDGTSVMFYEVLLDNYIVPPNEDNNSDIELLPKAINKINTENESQEQDIYGFKIFDINSKCRFTKCSALEAISEFTLNNKIIALKSAKENGLKTQDIIKAYKNLDFEPLYVACSEEMNYKPWGFFEKLFKAYYDLPTASKLIDDKFDAKTFNAIKNLILGNAKQASSPEDARFAYMELFVNFLKKLKNYVIIVDGFEYIDDTSIQTLELYFDKYVKVFNNFVFITDENTPVHSKINSLLQTFLYTEITVVPNKIEHVLSEIKEDASDFIQSFYYEKIKDNFKGSKLYFDHAVKYLIDKNVLAYFDDKLLIKNSSSFILPKDIYSLIRARLKTFGQNQDASMILAYSVFLGERLDFKTLELLGVNKIIENVKFLNDTGFTFSIGDSVYINNYNFVKDVIKASLKPEVIEFLAKTILAKLGKVLSNTSVLLLMEILSMPKEEYLLLWKNVQFCISVGDYDAYLKNCLKYLSVIDQMSINISEEEVENNKKEIFQNILMSLYSYSPAKIYSIENVLLMDAMQSGDNERIIKLSNLMLQGALITSNYTDALSLLHNILTRMPNPSLIVNGAINTKFLLLSLVNIEILFNIGNYTSCIEIAKELLNVIKPDIIPKIKPSNFSTNSFVSHMMDTFRLVAFAELLTCSEHFDEFFIAVEKSFDAELPEKDCIIALKDFLSGKKYTPSNIELKTPFSKVVFLILQELSNLKTNYKRFAQNIYQAKLLAADIQQTQLELICDLLIAYAYGKVGISIKAKAIFDDVLKKAESSAIYNIVIIAKYLYANEKININDIDDAILIINDILSDIQNSENKAKVFYAMFEKLFIDAVQKQHISFVNIDVEIKKLLLLSPNGELEYIVRSSEYADIMNSNESDQQENINDDNINDTEEVSPTKNNPPEDNGDADLSPDAGE